MSFNLGPTSSSIPFIVSTSMSFDLVSASIPITLSFSPLSTPPRSRFLCHPPRPRSRSHPPRSRFLSHPPRSRPVLNITLVSSSCPSSSLHSSSIPLSFRSRPFDPIFPALVSVSLSLSPRPQSSPQSTHTVFLVACSTSSSLSLSH